MAAYQHGVRNRQGTGPRLLNNQGQQIRGTGASANQGTPWGGGKRRPSEAFDFESENEGFFSDVLQKRFGGDSSMRDRLIGMFDSSDPMAAVNRFNEWSGNTGEVFNPGDAARAETGVWRNAAGQNMFDKRHQTAEQQAEALEEFNILRGFI